MPGRSELPIDAYLPEITGALGRDGALVLVAEPGAGKTTRVPGALLDAGLAGDGRIVVLQPRRLAARLAAQRISEERGEKVGQTIGYQVRFEDRTSKHTRIRFMTEAIAVRQLQRDPLLKDVQIVILDEFHERSLHADLTLTLLMKARETRPELKIVVMSATIHGESVAAHLKCQAIDVPGRTHPVEISHAQELDERPLETRVAVAVKRLANKNLDGDVLVFLPGASEIRRARDALAGFTDARQIELALLHGSLPIEAQDRAIRASDKPKVILSTNVAETSITIEGVTAVIDSGLARVARHSPFTGLPSLVTSGISQASAIQRAGRAGRTRPGKCVRLFTKHDFKVRPQFDAPEIVHADLTELILTLRVLGQRHLRELDFLDQPPAQALQAAEELLTLLGALDRSGSATDLARHMLKLPVHPRLARMVLEGQARGVGPRACLMAALLGERDIRRSNRAAFGRDQKPKAEVGSADLLLRVADFEEAESFSFGTSTCRTLNLDRNTLRSVERVRNQLAHITGCDKLPTELLETEETELMNATLHGFADRVARRRAPQSDEWVFASGGSGRRARDSAVIESEFAVVVDAQADRRGRTIIRSASAIEPDWLLDFPELIQEEATTFNAKTGYVERVRTLKYGKIIVDESRALAPHDAAAAAALLQAALDAGPARFCDAKKLETWQRRMAFAATQTKHAIDSNALVREALSSLCEVCTSFDELKGAGLMGLIHGALPAELRKKLVRIAPETVSLPGRQRVPVNYEADRPPWIASRIQDFFGLEDGPKMDGQSVSLVFHLLAPNKRAVQVTSDLRGFWERHYPSIRKELMRRYPKHHWPEDPVKATPRKPR